MRNAVTNLLDNLSPCVLSHSARKQLDSLLILIAELIIDTAVKLVKSTGTKTLLNYHFTNAIRILFTGDLCVNILQQADLQDKSIFDFDIFKTILVNQVPKSIRIVPECEQYLSYCVEYICKEILELGIANANIDEAEIISSRHLLLGIESDVELDAFFETFAFGFIQKIDALILPIFPFGQIVREVSTQLDQTDIKLSKMALQTLQQEIENSVGEILKEAKRVCEYAGRIKLTGKDIEFIVGRQ